MIFERSLKYEEVVNDLIENEQLLVMLKAENVKVVCVLSDNVKLDESKRRIYAEVEKIPPKYQWAVTADVMITIYSNNIAFFNEQKRRIVLLRELLKLSVDSTEGKRKVAIRDYDLKDFRCIVDRYGANWDQDDTLFDNAGD